MLIILRLLRFLRSYWKWVVLAYVCLIASTGFSLYVPELIKQAIDDGIRLNLQTGEMGGSEQLLWKAGLLIVGASLLRGLFGFGQTYLGEFISQCVAYDIRHLIYDRIQRLSFAFHDKAQTGQLMSRATQDVEAVRMFVSTGALRVASIIVMFVGICVVLLLMNWQLALISLAFMPPIGFLAYKRGTTLRPIWMSIQQGIAVLGTVIQEDLSGVRVVRAFSREHHESAKFEGEAGKLYGQNLLQARILAITTPLMTFLFIVASGLILWYGGREVVGGRLTTGELSAFYLYVAMLGMPISMMGFMVNLFTRAMSAGQRVFEVMDAESMVKESPDAAELSPVEGLVRFQGVSFGYDSLSATLSDIDLEAKPGEVTALLGATGSGKSTLVNLIPRFYDVTSGSITIDGVDIRDVTLASLRHNVGIVQQDVFLFSATIRDNIAYGAVDVSMEDVIAAARTAHLHDFIEGLPEGYDTWVGERGATLSGGQKQRLAIARTLLINPRILIFDDSTSSVDTETEFLIQQALRELMKGRTTFVIAQRLQTVKYAHQILLLAQGRIVERGTHSQLLEEGKVYPQLYELQLRDQEEAQSREAHP